MTFIIRNKEPYPANHPKISPNYWGTYRSSPSFVSEFDEEHPVNRAFFAYLEIVDDCDILYNLDQAYEIVEIYQKYNIDIYEIFEITRKLDKETTDSIFIGFDISNCAHYSCLLSGLHLSIEPEDLKEYKYKETYVHVEALTKITENFFKPHLNQHGLFSDYNNLSSG